MEVAPHTFTCSNPLVKFLLTVPVALCSAGLEVLVPEIGMLPPGHTTGVPLDRTLRPDRFGLLMPLIQ